jgi:hypothetical protein
MAYDVQHFINNVDPLTKPFGTNDEIQFNSWNNSEKYELESALGGEENMANFQYGEHQNIERTEEHILIERI